MIIKRPLVTEKAIAAQAVGKYGFVVDAKATKGQVATEFQTLFGIKPLKVNLLIIKGKVKSNWKTRTPIIRPNFKKAYITLKKDQKIDILTLKNEK
ncbi:MAG: 50S ribosomal protein L23 [Candidatus Shapirobacteria bacterium GW2011_GWE1_38_10]|uniref:Large ribosomal subunit protein uL23 n=1 Tax=Candidatus Shapirobacteria bacterium GW2011_GWE1_38_10 TaxID=1618488 RepID=A0A0G0I4B1_9BACT|nr:MAG: 50S ribosomal protein L23 [Candidatus Shapirobacteria bacterium GW2011_GWF2_37_20]KKQ50143.1 MAG: 50S ribosomal protein L23 [Candidatus Shapirobacteria bacterium GW2011_GWE1_38_10]KKQ64736.1 MAG: 50S ribosomal protein L23 [Candidatus Shapirobacteria bacterium GW2011_GWF1_38_23]HBP50892.1 50S ribosomal protein L23 [Candidatus Shapirobacteria bacterium]